MRSERTKLKVEIGPVETTRDLADVLALRMVVFVEEQRVPPEEELDAYDLTATHFFVRIRDGERKGEIVGTARIVDLGGAAAKIGRVAVSAECRGMGLGAALMRAIHEHAVGKGFSQAVLDAQCYAIPFYEKLGYVADGDIFLDANIEHRHMSLSLDRLASRDDGDRGSSADFN